MDLQMRNKALEEQIERVKGRRKKETKEIEQRAKTEAKELGDELQRLRKKIQADYSSSEKARGFALNEMLPVIDELVASKSAEASEARKEASRLSQEVASLMEENINCYQQLQNVVPIIELEKARLRTFRRLYS